jgi:hypothetical protein
MTALAFESLTSRELQKAHCDVIRTEWKSTQAKDLYGGSYGNGSKLRRPPGFKIW